VSRASAAFVLLARLDSGAGRRASVPEGRKVRRGHRAHQGRDLRSSALPRAPCSAPSLTAGPTSLL
jgi:hypothetical protein